MYFSKQHGVVSVQFYDDHVLESLLEEHSTLKELLQDDIKSIFFHRNLFINTVYVDTLLFHDAAHIVY